MDIVVEIVSTVIHWHISLQVVTVVSPEILGNGLFPVPGIKEFVNISVKCRFRYL